MRAALQTNLLEPVDVRPVYSVTVCKQEEGDYRLVHISRGQKLALAIVHMYWAKRFYVNLRIDAVCPDGKRRLWYARWEPGGVEPELNP